MKYATIERFPGYRFCDNGTVESCWTKQGTGRWRLGNEWTPKAATVSKKYLVVGLRDWHGVVRQYMLHRVILEAFVGPCPEGMEGCHYPDPNPHNCNLSNLRWDSQLANTADRDALNRTARGSRAGSAKLNETVVAGIKSALAAGVSVQDLAITHEVTPATIAHIREGRTWGHVDGPEPLRRIKRCQVTMQQIGQIIALHDLGRSSTQIVSQLMLPVGDSQVRRIIKRYAASVREVAYVN